MKPIKLLITSGCSYTAGPENWPNPTAEELKCSLNNFGTTSVGNGKISRSIIYGVTEALKTYNPEDILVGISWSGNSRREVFQSKVDFDNIHRISTENPTGFIPGCKNWVTLNHHWTDIYSTNYYLYLHDQAESEIITLEHILRTQWFLEKYKIKYFMTTFAPGVLPDAITQNNKHLFEQVNFDHFLKIKSIIEWCVEESGLPVNEDDRRWLNNFDSNYHESTRVIDYPFVPMHPTKDHSRKLAQDVIVPFLMEKYS